MGRHRRVPRAPASKSPLGAGARRPLAARQMRTLYQTLDWNECQATNPMTNAASHQR